MYQGGCMCGAVRFEISGPLRNVVYCHCSECRKLHGTPFASNAGVESRHFKFISGEDQLTVPKLGQEKI